MNLSPVITGAAAPQAAAQMAVSLVIEPGLSRRHTSLRDVVSTGVYQHGLSRVAAEVGVPAGNLSRQLEGSGLRRLSVDTLEAYIAEFDDLRPIHYLVERYVLASAHRADDAHKAAVLAQVQALMASLDR
ncbi:hypothetical protein [Hydrogenophaga electricum]|uniref:XRE family transcriptional regulator n=1 Tax=Hydrogenophaga electricum TaxID=1230953 RepID=A0ABQ6BZQ5_9BURK|nr:hypothetical protein [Hydrogenophaga electricum]GLS13623.1 hypothetical protein GCM10007935_10530 [Hydrogenophaga electricum]